MSKASNLVRQVFEDMAMNYMLLVYRSEDAGVELSHSEGKTCDGLAERLHEQGKYLAGGILQPTPYATSVQLRNGRRLVMDGPFAETHEQLAGYLLVSAENLDEAIDIASQHPVAKVGTVEIRPMKLIPSFEHPAHEESSPSAA